MPFNTPRRGARTLRPLAGALAVGALTACGGAGTGVASAAGIGQPDAAFDGDGIVTLDSGTQIKGAVVQTDGKVVLAGFSGTETKPVPYAVRLNSDGTRDGSFQPQLPTSGAALAGADSLALTDVKLRSGGRLVFSGTSRTGETQDGMVAISLNASGARDTSFSGDGVATVAAGGERAGEANAIAVAPDGKIVLGGLAYDDKTFLPSATVARLTTTGEPDGALGAGLTVGRGPSQLNGVAVQSDGGIIGVGQRTEGQPVLALVARVTAGGSVDTSFRGNGSFSRQYAGEGGAFSALNDVAIDGAGRILATGTSRRAAAPSGQSVTVRYTPAGADDTFGSGGNRTLDASQTDRFVAPNPGGYGIAVDGGRVYVGGTFDAGLPQFSATLLNDAGNLDGSFGSGGQTRFGVAGDVAVRGTGGVALGPDGLYVAGTAGDAGAVARFGTVARVDAVPAPVPTPPADGAPLTTNPATPSPGGTGTGTGTATPRVTAPTLSGTSLKPTKITAKKPATLKYRFSKAGLLTLAVEQKVKGRRATAGKSKGTCEKNSSKNTKGKACTFYAQIGSARSVKVSKAGARTLKLTRKVTNRTLKNGTYRLVLQALDPTRKAKGTVRRITFRVATR